MSNNGEDIIRETFKKLGAAIGVQMQMPDAMIANLGAVLQAQIDLLAELQSTGRLIPAGGRGLEFSEVEALRSAWEELKGYRVDGYARPYVNQMVKVVGALFPATEPAEEAAEEEVAERELTERLVEKWTSAMNAARKSEHHFPADCLAEAIAILLGRPTPAEPAEEETKAEASQNIEVMQWDGTRASISAICKWVNSFDAELDDHTMTYCFSSTAPDDVFDVFLATAEGDVRVSDGDFIVRDLQGNFYRRDSDAYLALAASSPVVPAPTETEAGHA